MGCPVVHFEIGGRDSAKLSAFYAKLFDWKVDAYGPAQMINTGNPVGIQGHINALGHEPHTYSLIYVMVNDIPAYIKKAEAAGATMIVPETEVPGTGHFAWLKDPEGNLFGLWKAMGEKPC
ncbi:MAG: hypothetical protein HBSAPP03_05900 [Phycisphaerae bacterium]|nr:MAG: hypothetical protein HBSAPP03_05900 [Phycisphaerae bacterium]